MSQRPRPYTVLADDTDVSDSSGRDGEPGRQDDRETERVRGDAIDRVERTLDLQRKQFDRIDQKASKLLQVTVLLAGTVFALLGLGNQFREGAVSRLAAESTSVSLKIALVVAGVGFVGTVLLATATIVTTRFGGAVGASSIAERVLDIRVGPEAYYQLLLGTYLTAIEENRRRVDKNNRRFVATLCLLVTSITALTAGAVFVLLSPVARVRQAILGVAVVIVIFFTTWAITASPE